MAPRRVFESQGQLFEIVRRTESLSASEATSLLTPLFTAPTAAHELRRLAMDVSPALQLRDDKDVLAQLVAALAGGRLVLLRADIPSRGLLSPGLRKQPAKPRDEPDHFAPTNEPTETHWIEIQLVDESGAGVPRQRFIVVASDGRKHTGYTDSLGSARVTRLPAGDCMVFFPDLDGREWEQIRD